MMVRQVVLMHSLRPALVLAVCAVLACSGLASQNSPSPQATASALANKDIRELLKAGLTQEIVIAKIKSSACDFDTSPDELKELKAANVPDSVILAMVQAPNKQRETSAQPPNLPIDNTKPSASAQPNTTPAQTGPVTTPPTPLAVRRQEGTPGCKIYFDIYWADPHIPGGLSPGMHKEQASWYKKTGKKKFPSICLDQQKATHVVVWSSSMVDKSAVIPVTTEGTTYSSGSTAGLPTSGTSTTSITSLGTMPYQTNSVYVFVFRKKDSQSLEEKPIYATHRETWWTYRAAFRQSLEDALNFISSADKTPAPAAAPR